MMIVAIALVFIAIVGTVVGVWFVLESRRELRARLGDVAKVAEGLDQRLLRERTAASMVQRLLGHLAIVSRLNRLREQSGVSPRVDLPLLISAFAVVGGVLAGLRTSSVLWGLVWAGAAALLPVAYFVRRRQKRMHTFEQQFPDALDLMTRSLRAGHALGGSIQQVGENMPEPVGLEFRRVAEEMRLGLEPGAALSRLEERVPLQDVRFFCTAVRIQRSAGGNLAEILERLSDVVRERFKLLSQARALAAQHKWSAICVGLSPLAFALIFGILQPGYFDPLLQSEHRVLLIGGGLVLEALGFLSVWRIAQIEV